jgi:hypothetical protein
MATSDILGLFVSPEQYQAQQMAQQQANEQARAINFANLDPRGQANYGVFMGAQQLGRGFGGLLGVQDPQLQRIRQRQEIMQTINPADPESLMAGIQRASQAGDQELALSLTDFMNKQGSEMALAQQRTAAANKERVQSQSGGIQEAARIREIETQLATLDKVENKTEYDALVAERTRLQRSARAATTTEKQRDAEAYANTVSDDPDSEQWKNAYKDRLNRLQLGKEGVEKKSDFAQKLEDAGYIPGSPAYVSMMDKFLTKELENKGGAEKKSAFAQQLEDAGYIPGSPMYVSMMDRFLTKELAVKEDRDQITAVGETVAGNKEGLPAGLKVYTNKTSKTQYVLRDGTEVPYYGAVEPPGKTTVEVKNVMPGQGKDGPKGISSFRNEVIQSIKPFRDMVTGADSALASIKDSIAKGNFISFNAARTQLAKALGDTSLSRRDIEQAGADPSILGGLYDKASTLFTGSPSPDTQKKIESTLKVIRKVAIDKANAELGVQRNLGKRAGYTDDDINIAFDFPEFKAPAAKPSGGNKAVDFNDLPK